VLISSNKLFVAWAASRETIYRIWHITFKNGPRSVPAAAVLE